MTSSLPPSGPQDPSLEELLSSIRKMIEEDSAEAEEPDAPPLKGSEDRVGYVPAAVSEEAHPHPLFPELPAMQSALPEEETVREDFRHFYTAPFQHRSGGQEEKLPRFSDQDYVAGRRSAPSAPLEEPKEDVVLSPETIAATQEALYSFENALESTKATENEPKEGTHEVTAWIKSLVRPMVKEWLDAHLPEIVRRSVQEHLSFITRGKK